MKKKPDSIDESKTYEGIRLYRDEIELILSVFHEHGYTVEITDTEFQFDSLDELIEKRGISPTYFKIEGNQKEPQYESVSISFDKHKRQIRIYSYSFAHKTSKIIFTKIKDFCESRMSTIYKILNPDIATLGVILIVSLLLSGLLVSSLSKGKFNLNENLNENTWVFVLPTFLIAVGLLSSLYRFFRRHQVILRRKHEGGFWKRNSDKIWLAIFFTLFGIFLKFILELIIASLLKTKSG